MLTNVFNYDYSLLSKGLLKKIMSSLNDSIKKYSHRFHSKNYQEVMRCYFVNLILNPLKIMNEAVSSFSQSGKTPDQFDSTKNLV